MSADINAVAIVAMGEMGSAISARLVQGGVRVLTSLEGRSPASAARAIAAGIEDVDEGALVTEADIVLSIVPPHAAVDNARRFAERLRSAARRPLFLDCNAIAPQTLETIASVFREWGLRFGDASIIGAPPKPKGGSGPRFYMSGDVALEADWFIRHGLDARLLSNAPGDASALKMAYAGMTKGFQALAIAIALGAERNGVSSSFKAELQASLQDLHSWLSAQLPRMPAKAYRWDGEMSEIARFLEPESGSTKMLVGAAELYAAVAKAHAGTAGSDILEVLERFAIRDRK